METFVMLLLPNTPHDQGCPLMIFFPSLIPSIEVHPSCSKVRGSMPDSYEVVRFSHISRSCDDHTIFQEYCEYICIVSQSQSGCDHRVLANHLRSDMLQFGNVFSGKSNSIPNSIVTDECRGNSNNNNVYNASSYITFCVM